MVQKTSHQKVNISTTKKKKENYNNMEVYLKFPTKTKSYISYKWLPFLKNEKKTLKL